MAIRILLADDHRIMREGLRSLLADRPDIQIVGEAADGKATVRLASQLGPDMVIMDVTMPVLNGLEATRQIVTTQSDVKVLALSMHATRQYVLRMLQAGASAYLLKADAFQELYEAIQTVSAGGFYLSSQLTNTVIRSYASLLLHNEAGAAPLLTPEKEVLQLLSEGKAVKVIAELLNISVKTVETHRRRVMTKLDLHSVAELTKFAISEGMTSVDI